jgi:hypothetical protein
MQKFQFFTASPLKMRACGTGRKFAEYNQREQLVPNLLTTWDKQCEHDLLTAC